MNMPGSRLKLSDYAALANFRYLLHRFLEFSETEAGRAGLTSRQHQALLAIKGFGGGKPLAVGELAERLAIRHHSAVELADRLADGGLIVREHDPSDQRRVLLALTEKAEGCLRELSVAHRAELRRIRPLLERALEAAAESK